MKVELLVARRRWTISLREAIDWTVPAAVGDAQTAAFGLRSTERLPVAIGGGRRLSVRDGASVNCADVHMNPHGAGTHTECIGHVSSEAREVRTLAIPALLAATVLSVVPVRLGTTADTYAGDGDPDDLVVAVTPLARALAELGRPGFDEAIILRTREDDDEARDWTGTNPAYLTREAIAFLAALPTQHLLVDLPSIDREKDGGGVPNHLCWWGLPPGERSEKAAQRPHRSLTELVHIPQRCGDGGWIVALQVPAFGGDAAPSRLLAWRPDPLLDGGGAVRPDDKRRSDVRP